MSYKEMKLMDLAKLVNDMNVDDVIDFVNGDSESAVWYGGWCGIKRVNPFDNDNPQYLIGYYGGEANTRFYAISEYDPRIGDFCAKRLEHWDYVNEKYVKPKEENWIACVARMIADFVLDYDGAVSEVITVDDGNA